MTRLILLSLALLALLAAGCQNDPVGMTPDQTLTPTVPDKGTAELSPRDLWTDYNASLEAEYEVFEGLYTPGTDAILGGILQSWPGTYAAGITIPAGALPDDYGPVTISISVPKFKKHVPYEDQPPMVIILEPDGIQFIEPVEVMVYYPPWLDDPDGSPLFKVFCMQPVYVNGQLERVGYSDFQWLDRGTVTATPGPLVFQVPHFSRWETGQDEPDDGTADPNDDDLPPDITELP